MVTWRTTKREMEITKPCHLYQIKNHIKKQIIMIIKIPHPKLPDTVSPDTVKPPTNINSSLIKTKNKKERKKEESYNDIYVLNYINS